MVKLSKENIFIGLVILVAFLYIARTYIFVKKDGFADPVKQALDADLTLQFCPPGTQSYQSKNGDTDCCQGEYLDFKCKGSTLCTMSPSHDGLPPCLEALKTRLRAKAQTTCPTSMPNYYENPSATNSLPGCTSGPRLPDGTGPKDSTQEKCQVYATDTLNTKKVDSCYNQKRLEAVVCPAFPNLKTSKAIGQWNEEHPVYFYCQIQNSFGATDFCVEDASLKSFWDVVWSPWRNQVDQYSTWLKPIFCSVYKQLRVDKTISDDQLKNVKVS
jgi:hypothetical protein